MRRGRRRGMRRNSSSSNSSSNNRRREGIYGNSQLTIGKPSFLGGPQGLYPLRDFLVGWVVFLRIARPAMAGRVCSRSLGWNPG